MNSHRWIGLIAALALSAGFYIVASPIDGVSPWPAAIGALIGAGIEILPRRPRAVPADVTVQTIAGAPPAADHGWGSPPPPAVPQEPVTLAPSTAPAEEMPCHTCGLYPAVAPDVRALPQPGTALQYGPD